MKKAVLVFLFIVFMITPLLHAEDSDDSLSFLMDHLKRYPQMQADDIYKLLYQAANGPLHYGVQYERILNYLNYETSLLENEKEYHYELIEPIGDTFVRVHLRPYYAAGGSVESLAKSFLLSMKMKPDTTKFLTNWNKALKLSGSGNFANISHEDFIHLDSLAREHSYPAVHHSDIYKQMYHPHYRVLTKEIADSLLASLRNN